MKIKDLRVHSIAMADPPLRSSYGLHQPYALRTILEIESEEGVVGIAETYGGAEPAKALLAIRERLLGNSPLRALGLSRELLREDASGMARSQTTLVPGENPLDADARTYAALETACLDLAGKTWQVPLSDLLGGRVREKASFSAYPFYKHAGGGGEGKDSRKDEYGEALCPASLAEQAERMVGQYGFREIKLKAGVLEPEAEIETIRELRRKFGPGVPLRIDPNCAWSVDTSVKVGLALAEELSNGGYLEDPTSGLEGMSEVRKRLLAEGVDTPLASNVSVTSFGDLPEAVGLDAVQVVLCDHHYWGGFRQVQHLAKICETFGLGLSMHSNNHLGVSMMAMAQVAVATPHLTYACDTHYPWQTERDEVVAGGRVPIAGGVIDPGHAPGLGVELDPDRLAEASELYRSIPYRKRDDEAEMRKYVDPDWKRTLPRW